MRRILVFIVAVIVGLVVGMLANILILNLNHQFFPMPDGVSYEDQETFNAWLTTLPQTAFILVVVAHLAQAFFGALIAALIAKHNMLCVAMAVSILTMIGGIANLLMIPAPAWMWIEMPLYLVVAWLAVTLVSRMRVKFLASTTRSQ
jgi:hypothetical protein